MEIDRTQPHVLSHIKVDIGYQDLAQQIKTSGNRPEMGRIAKRLLDKTNNVWKPAAVYRWVEFQRTGADTTGRIIPSSGSPLDIDFGYSIKFLTHASHAMVSVYTAGRELERKSMEASQKGDILEAYFIDLIGLTVLEKTGERIKQIAQKKAAETDWGVSPFLSPGSVHGWELEEQIKLCSLLPLERIDVKIREDAVLSPFKTISCLIGMGPGYDDVKVGATCQVCSKRHECQMKQTG